MRYDSGGNMSWDPRSGYGDRLGGTRSLSGRRKNSAHVQIGRISNANTATLKRLHGEALHTLRIQTGEHEKNWQKLHVLSSGLPTGRASRVALRLIVPNRTQTGCCVLSLSGSDLPALAKIVHLRSTQPPWTSKREEKEN